MAREILFKAKRIDNGKWIEGYYFKSYGCRNGKRYDVHIIHNYDTDENYLIDVDTLCQYTGLTDKNGNKIWENDVVSGDGEKIGYVVFHRGSWVVWGADVDIYEDFLSNLCSKCYSSDRGSYIRAEVIGNIFDNKELLGGGE